VGWSAPIAAAFQTLGHSLGYAPKLKHAQAAVAAARSHNLTIHMEGEVPTVRVADYSLCQPIEAATHAGNEDDSLSCCAREAKKPVLKFLRHDNVIKEVTRFGQDGSNETTEVGFIVFRWLKEDFYAAVVQDGADYWPMKRLPGGEALRKMLPCVCVAA
jgi:hypothetical protein